MRQDYDKSFEVRMNGRTMIFDSFECAIQALAPVCPHCGCRIIGHGVQHGDTIFLLLRPLRRGGRRQRPARPRLGSTQPDTQTAPGVTVFVKFEGDVVTFQRLTHKPVVLEHSFSVEDGFPQLVINCELGLGALSMGAH